MFALHTQLVSWLKSDVTQLLLPIGFLEMPGRVLFRPIVFIPESKLRRRHWSWEVDLFLGNGFSWCWWSGKCFTCWSWWWTCSQCWWIRDEGRSRLLPSSRRSSSRWCWQRHRRDWRCCIQINSFINTETATGASSTTWILLLLTDYKTREGNEGIQQECQQRDLFWWQTTSDQGLLLWREIESAEKKSGLKKKDLKSRLKEVFHWLHL